MSAERGQVDRTRITQAALGLLDQVGLDGLTMRSLADTLGIQAASLYYHFKGKRLLIEAMADLLIETATFERNHGAPWDQAVRGIAMRLRAALRSRRDGARVFAGSYGVTENVVRLADRIIGYLKSAGLGDQQATRAATSIIYFVLGFCIEEEAFVELQGDAAGLAVRRQAFRDFVADRYIHVEAAEQHIFDADFEARFAFGLDLIIAGIRHGDA